MQSIIAWFKRLFGLDSADGTNAPPAVNPTPPIVAFLIALSQPGAVQTAWCTQGREAGVQAWPQWQTLSPDDYTLLVSGTLDDVSARVRQLGSASGGGQVIWICIWIK